jgi:hypothetical protein
MTTATPTTLDELIAEAEATAAILTARLDRIEATLAAAGIYPE